MSTILRRKLHISPWAMHAAIRGSNSAFQNSYSLETTEDGQGFRIYRTAFFLSFFAAVDFRAQMSMESPAAAVANSGLEAGRQKEGISLPEGQKESLFFRNLIIDS
ncbi:hypothetical protein IAS59_003119 [Cryptococcus gattii]